MRAAIFYAPERIRIDDIPKPKPEAEDVLIKVGACAICGSDRTPYLHIGWDENIVPGHEITGTVVERGSKVKKFEEGEKVALYTIIHCGKCYFCKKGLTQFCKNRQVLGFNVNGGYAEYVKVPERCLLRLPGDISLEEGTFLLDMIGVPAYGFKKVSAVDLDTFAVYGCGNIGLGAIITLKTLGKEDIFAIDVIENRLKAAGNHGARFLINAEEENPAETIGELTYGLGVDLAIDASGSPKAELDAIESTKIGGKVLFIGENRSLEISPSSHMIHKDLTLAGTFYFPKEEFKNNVKILLQKREDFQKTISHRFPLEDINEAFQTFFKKVEAQRVIINP